VEELAVKQKIKAERKPQVCGPIGIKVGAEGCKNEGWVFCSVPEAYNTKVARDQYIQDIQDVLAITEGQFGRPITRSGRFLNANHPPKDATEEELEAIARFWGDADDIPADWAERVRALKPRGSVKKYEE